MPKVQTKTAASLSNIHAVVGSDEGEVKRAAAELAAKLTPIDAGDFGLEIIDGAADNADQAASRIRSAIEALQTIPFFGAGKLVWLKNANFLGDNILGHSASVQEALEELAAVLTADLGPEVKFLLSAAEVDKRRSFYKTLTKRAETQVMDKLDASRTGWEEAASDLVQRFARQRRLQFDEEALELFVLLTGGDTRQITNEIEKIDLYLGDRGTGFQPVGQTGSPAAARVSAAITAGAAVPRITVDQVRALVPLSRAGVIFELGNALAGSDLDRALKLVRGLLDQGESAIGILLVAIVPTIRNLLLAKDLMQRHRLTRPAAPFSFISALNRLPEGATEHLPRKKDGTINGFALGIAAQHAHRFEVPQLIEGLEACLQGNVQLVSSQLDHELILTEIVVKLLGRK